MKSIIVIWRFKLKITIDKIYNFITKLILLLELELDDLKDNKNKTNIITQKSIADILNKLVKLISQLNKLTIENENTQDMDLTLSDQAILDKYINIELSKKVKINEKN